MYCDESGNVRIINDNGEIVWEVFFSYHTGFVPGKLLIGRERIYAYSGNIISFINRDQE